jgi:hypothetical protein
MKIVKDNRLPEFKRIEHLLYGINYVVWFNLYGPLDPDLSLEKVLKSNVSENGRLSGIVPSSPEAAKTEIMAQVLYEGDESSGPLQLNEKKEEIISLLNNVFSQINIEEADLVAEFGFCKGHPAYPVFWDFAYDIHSNGKRWIFIGSSSD